MKRYALIMLLGLGLTSCEGVFDGIYDTPVADTEFSVGIHPGIGEGRYTLMLDARDYLTWHYISLKDLSITPVAIPTTLTGEWDGTSGTTYNEVNGDEYTPYNMVPTDAQPEPDVWDFAIHHFDVKTHDAVVAETQYESLDALPKVATLESTLTFQPDVWTTTQVITDLTEMMGYHIGYQNSMANLTMSQWATMDFTTPPPTYAKSGKVYLMRLADGSYAAIHLKSYLSNAGTKGFLTVEIQYPCK